MALLAPANHPRMECEKTETNNLFESILNGDVLYSIVVKNITAEETSNMFKAFAMRFLCFFIYYIQFALSKNLEAKFF